MGRSSKERIPLQPGLAVASAAVLAVSIALMLRGVPPFSTDFYELAWWSLIGLLDGLIWWRRGESAIGSRPLRFILLGLWSVAFWFFFEIINLRLENWYYVNVTHSTTGRWLGSFLAFGTVLPAVYLAAEAIGSFLRPVEARPAVRRVPRLVPRLMVMTGIAFFFLPLLWPRHFFPLVWGAVFFLLEPLNYRLGGGSLLREWERGSYRTLGIYLAAGLGCGLLWESLNYWAPIKWIYTVPFFEELKIFEMPVLGFLGFPPFAVECYAVIESLRLGRLLGPERPAGARGGALEPLAARLPAFSAAACSAVLFAAIALPGMERNTFASIYPAIGHLEPHIREVAPGALDSITSASDAFTLLDELRSRPAREGEEELVSFLEMVTLAGIGAEKALALRAIGVRTVGDLARSEWREIYGALRERMERGRLTPAEVRVWWRAARKAAAEP
jgi:hypothetical protein